VTPTSDHTGHERTTATARLLRAYRERGDKRARDRIVQLYMPLIAVLASRYEDLGRTHEVAMRAGSVGLVDAIERYVPRRREEFIEFALPIVASEIRACLNEETGDVLPDSAPELDMSRQRGDAADALSGLDETERAIVNARFVEGLGTDEAAAELGMPESELSQRTRTTLVKIRAALERLGSGRAAATELPPGDADPGAASEPRAGDAKNGHSGRLLLRMPQGLHTELASAAERDQMSLNQFILETLAAGVGWHQAGDHQQTRSSPTRRPPPRWLPAAIVANIVVLAVAAVVAVIVLLAGLQGW
jgi:RNA polymerase sigma factor (sigma-70 family)